MDSQHRHELQENELAHWLEDKVELIKQNATLIILALVALVSISAAWGYYQDASVASNQSEWDLFTTAMLDRSQDLSSLESVTEELQGGAADHWASITLADGKLYEATRGWLNDRDKATEALTQARDLYQSLQQDRAVPASIRQRASFGLARGFELEGDLEQARQLYQGVQGEYAKIAADRAESLESEQAQQTIAWLQSAKAEPFGAGFGLGEPAEEPSFEPDDLETPAEESAEADSATSEETLEDILGDYERRDAEQAAAQSATSEAEPEAADASAAASAESDSTDNADQASEE